MYRRGVTDRVRIGWSRVLVRRINRFVLQGTAAPVGRRREHWWLTWLRVLRRHDFSRQWIEHILEPLLRFLVPSLCAEARADQIRNMEKHLPEVQTVAAIKRPVLLDRPVGPEWLVNVLGIPGQQSLYRHSCPAGQNRPECRVDPYVLERLGTVEAEELRALRAAFIDRRGCVCKRSLVEQDTELIASIGRIGVSAKGEHNRLVDGKVSDT